MGEWSYPVRVLSTFSQRLRGLLGTGVDADPVVLVGCSSVHTFGMAYPIDVAFLSPRGEVLKVVRELVPGRLASCHGALYVFERPSAEGLWVRSGDRLICALVDMGIPSARPFDEATCGQQVLGS